jgi:pilus assembly protein CpaF
VQASRLRDGSRKVTHITEISGMEGDTVILNNIFYFNEDGDGTEGKVSGYHTSNGLRPACEPLLRPYGYNLPATMFMKKTKRS